MRIRIFSYTLLSAFAGSSLSLAGLSHADEYIIDTATFGTNGGGTNPASLSYSTLSINGEGSIEISDAFPATPAVSADEYSYLFNDGTISTGGESSTAVQAIWANGISNSGSIRTLGDYSDGILLGYYNTSENSGLIEVQGEFSYGVTAFSDNLVFNSGTILATNLLSYGIYADSGNMVENSGVIRTEGILGIGIRLNGGNQLLDSGTIVTLGDYAYGIHSTGGLQGDEIEHKGSIHTSGYLATGIKAADYTTIDSRGWIITEGMLAPGIAAGNANMISHGGVIRVTGAGSNAIEIAGNDNLLSVSGVLASLSGNAIEISGQNNTLHLKASAPLIGGISLHESTEVAIDADLSGAVFRTLSGLPDTGAPAVTSSMPWSYDPASQSFATYDPTGLSVANLTVGEVAASIHGLATGKGDGRASPRASGGSGAISAGDGRIWAAGLGSRGSRSGSVTSFAYDTELTGLAIGIEHDHGDWQLGALAGVAGTEFAWNPGSGTHRVTGDGGFAAIHGSHARGPLVIDLSLAGGWIDYAQSRLVLDNLSQSGLSQVKADYRSIWASPSIAVSYPIEALAEWQLAPRLRASYAAQWIEAYREYGAASQLANLVAGRRQTGVGEIRAELSAGRLFAVPLGELEFDGHAGAFSRESFGDDELGLALNETRWSVASPDERIDAAFVGGTTRLWLGDLANLSLSGEAAYGSHGYQQFRGALTFTGRF